jgi:putative peptide zinc metalloprotease protein
VDIEQDPAIRELGRLQLKLRHDLIFTPQRSGRETYYVIEDPVNAKFHRVGPTEYAFLSLLDGKTSVNEALRNVASAAPEHAISEFEAANICKWLVDTDLAKTPESALPSQLLAKAATVDQRQLLGRLNPIMFRLPLFHPDRLFTKLLPWLSWTHTPPALMVWALMAVVALYQATLHWDRFAASSRGVLAPHNWLWLLVTWIGLKFVHETAHGIACKRYGGSVHEAGVLLLLFAPLAYVDVTSSWRFPSKWQRIQTAAAGMYMEIVAAALATFVWVATDPGPLNNACHNVMITAGFMTLVINVNPLMRFDGYYILSDLLEIPNLYANGQQYVSYWTKKWLLGIDAARPCWSRSRGGLITLFGLAALVWRILVCAGLVIAATTLFHGAGIVLAGVAVILWVALPAGQLIAKLVDPAKRQRPHFVRLFGLGGLLIAATVALLLAVPWPGASWAPAVVEYEPFTPVRAGSAGFVRELRVSSGQQVNQGDVLAVLLNDGLEVELRGLDIGIEQSLLNCRMFKQSGKMASYQAERKNLEALQTQQAEKARQVDHLTIRAPRSGHVIGRQFALLLGRHVEEGDEIAAIGDEAAKELRVSVSQDDHDVFRACVGQAVVARIGPAVRLRAPLDSLDPRGRLDPLHPALCAALGGPLPVRQEEDPAADDGQDRGPRYVLLNPRFTATVRLTPAESRQVRAGQLGRVSIRAYRKSIGRHLYEMVARWVRVRMGAVR